MGSIPIIGSIYTFAIGIDMQNDPDLERVKDSLDPGRLPKWTKGTDCKSVGTGLRWFESNTVHFWQPLASSRIGCPHSSGGRAHSW